MWWIEQYSPGHIRRHPNAVLPSGGVVGHWSAFHPKVLKLDKDTSFFCLFIKENYPMLHMCVRQKYVNFKPNRWQSRDLIHSKKRNLVLHCQSLSFTTQVCGSVWWVEQRRFLIHHHVGKVTKPFLLLHLLLVWQSWHNIGGLLPPSVINCHFLRP